VAVWPKRRQLGACAVRRWEEEKIEGSDVDYVMNYMAARKDENPKFYFDFSVDDECRLQNMFWSNSQSQLDYVVFGDVVVFDSTYKVNSYNLPFVPFDHHRTIVYYRRPYHHIFGC
jgi:hypothetical protein